MPEITARDNSHHPTITLTPIAPMTMWTCPGVTQDDKAMKPRACENHNAWLRHYVSVQSQTPTDR